MRGQVEAPIELVVGIIIFGMAIGMAFYVINQSQYADSLKRVRGEMEKIQLAMQDVTVGYMGSQREIVVSLPTSSGRIKAIRIAYFPSQEFCWDCPGKYGGCWKIEPLVYDLNLKDYNVLSGASVCVDVPGEVVLYAGSGCLSLSEKTCPINDPDCKTGGIPAAIVAKNPGMTFMTLGTEYRVYTLRLKKTVAYSGQREVGAIEICAKGVGSG